MRGALSSRKTFAIISFADRDHLIRGLDPSQSLLRSSQSLYDHLICGLRQITFAVATISVAIATFSIAGCDYHNRYSDYLSCGREHQSGGRVVTIAMTTESKKTCK